MQIQYVMIIIVWIFKIMPFVYKDPRPHPFYDKIKIFFIDIYSFQPTYLTVMDYFKNMDFIC